VAVTLFVLSESTQGYVNSFGVEERDALHGVFVWWLQEELPPGLAAVELVKGWPRIVLLDPNLLSRQLKYLAELLPGQDLARMLLVAPRLASTYPSRIMVRFCAELGGEGGNGGMVAHPRFHPTIHSSFQSYMYACIRSSTHPSVRPIIMHLSIHSSIILSIHQFIYQFLQLFDHSSAHLPIHSPSHSFILSFIHSFIHLFIHSSMDLPICPSNHSFIHLHIIRSFSTIHLSIQPIHSS
jgi:hypothetical protein